MMRAAARWAAGVLLLSLHAAHAAPQIQTEERYLTLLGHVAEMHLDTASRDTGVCPPELVVSLSRVGDPLVPRPESYALSPIGPAGALGMTLSPLRFRVGEHQLSVLDLDLAYETTAGASGMALQVGVLKADFSF
ncbi:hypothetical protein ACN28E_38410 [Archangium lansingense]|jgi:hypothetical protein|uniref:hypothetical protein n=1 Tax=Archangium lansingense TaxID=2995310 RepID=UPI003B80A801